MRPYLAAVEQEWIALGRKPLAGRKASILSLVTSYPRAFPDITEAMSQAIEAELSDAGKTRQGKDTRGRKPALRPEGNGNGDVPDARLGERRCNQAPCKKVAAPERKKCFPHLEKQREAARIWARNHRTRSA